MRSAHPPKGNLKMLVTLCKIDVHQKNIYFVKQSFGNVEESIYKIYWSFEVTRYLWCSKNSEITYQSRYLFHKYGTRLDGLATEFLREMCKWGHFFMYFSSISID